MTTYINHIKWLFSMLIYKIKSNLTNLKSRPHLGIDQNPTVGVGVVTVAFR